jgi:hypothetical protein
MVVSAAPERDTMVTAVRDLCGRQTATGRLFSCPVYPNRAGYFRALSSVAHHPDRVIRS